MYLRLRVSCKAADADADASLTTACTRRVRRREREEESERGKQKRGRVIHRLDELLRPHAKGIFFWCFFGPLLSAVLTQTRDKLLVYECAREKRENDYAASRVQQSSSSSTLGDGEREGGS